jgi:hypothetical protein
MGAPARPLEERIREKIEIDPVAGCWLWTGAIGSGGYAYIGSKNRSFLVHRVTYEMHRGPIPEGMQIDHLCRVRRCVNPDHLEPVTHAQNARRGALGAKTHCWNGHPFSPENTYIDKFGCRKCRACGREKYHQRREAMREQRMEFRARRKEAQALGVPVPKIARPLKTHCKHGHPYDEENTYISPKGRRRCRACLTMSMRKADELRRAGFIVDVPPGPEIVSPGILDLRTPDQNVPPPPPPKSTHCPHGHLFDEANTYVYKNGSRHCRACIRERTAARRARMREAPDYQAPVRVKATHCAKGHPFDEANTIWQGGGARRCRICANAYGAAWKARKVAKLAFQAEGGAA